MVDKEFYFSCISFHMTSHYDVARASMVLILYIWQWLLRYQLILSVP